jgi:pyruvate carboxylase
MVANELTPDDLLNSDRELAFPESVIDLLSGAMGQPPGGFPKPIIKRILKDRPAFEGRPGATLPPVDFEEAAEQLATLLGRPPSHQEVLSSLLYPQVFQEFAAHRSTYGDTSVLPTPTFFFGMQPSEEFAADIEPGKTLFIKYLATGSPQPDGTRTVFFELNGQPRDVAVDDRSNQSSVRKNIQADPANPAHVPASMPGMVVSVAVHQGDRVTKGQKLLVVEAMKMQTTFNADRAGTIGQLLVKPGTQIAASDLLLTIE